MVPGLVTLTVYGKAETQGSKVARTFGGKAWVVEGDSKKSARHKGWREAVADEARRWQHEHGAELITGPVVVTIRFYLPKPASAPKRRKTWPKSGDLDKLARSVLDSLTHTIIANDNQVVAGPWVKDYGDPPRAEISIVPVPDDVTGVRVSFEFDRDLPVPA